MSARRCVICGKDPATGFASMWTANTGERWFCHGDNDSEPTCYERATLDDLLDAGDGRCHCGRFMAYGFDGDPTHHRGMCEDCDAVRCDAYPMECPHRIRVVTLP